MKRFLRGLAQVWLKIFYPRLFLIEKKDADIGSLIKNINESIISEKAKIYGHCQIGNSQIDDYTYVSNNAVISLTTIGKFCSIGPNLFCGFGIHPIDGISTSPAFYSTHNQCGLVFSKTDKIVENKPIIIGNDVFIGMNVTILDGVTIGDGAVIGAGAVVSKDIPPYAVAVGSPIRIIKYRFADEEIENLLKIKWWNFQLNELKDVERHFYDVQSFIDKYK
jgi:acetyltransferase-like isoleucine patch superfamily enzyme